MSAIRNDDFRQSPHLRPGQFYGEVTRERRCHGLVLSELRHGTGRRLAAHSHELANFCLLVGGHYSEDFGRKTLTYSPLTVVFHPPHWAHRDEVGGRGGHFFSVELEPHWIERLRAYAPAARDAVVGAPGSDLSWMAARLHREFRRAELASPLAVEGLVMAMLADVVSGSIKTETRKPAWLPRVLELLREEFRASLTVSRVAAEVGVHPFHLSRVFRQFQGRTVGEYVNALRVEYACRELAAPERGLAEIALAAGFSDQSHFTRVFKQLTGRTPGEFRAILSA